MVDKEDSTHHPHFKDRKMNPRGEEICLKPYSLGHGRRDLIPYTWPPDFLSHKVPSISV